MGIDLQLLQQLSNGHFYSGESLAQQLGVSRTTIWKEINRLEEQYAVKVQSVKGRGYRLSQPLELLDESRIYTHIPESSKSQLQSIELLPIVDSTNRYLMAAASRGAASGQVIFAEQQTAGRGRQGRNWVSPFACNIYCSLLWRFEIPTSALSGLGIVIAVAVERALSNHCSRLHIKWPNDILYEGKKLAGILLEMQGEANGPASIVIGVGINVKMPATLAQEIDQAWTDLYQVTGKPVSRNALAADVIHQLIQAIQVFEQQGLESFIPAWEAKDLLRDQAIEILLGEKLINGIARGIDKTGALQLEIAGEIKSFMAGEARLCKRSGVSV